MFIYGSAGNPPATATFEYFSADFDGSSYVSRGATPTGLTDAKTGTLNLWMKMDAASSDTAFYVVNDTNSARLKLFRDNAGKWILLGLDSAGGTILQLKSITSHVIATGWAHFLMSWDMNQAGKSYMSMDDIDVTDRITHTNGTLDYTTGDWFVGSTNTGGSKFKGKICEYYFSNEYFDLNIEANRRKFISASGLPVDLGSTGQIPSGTSPAIYLRNEVPAWDTNIGTGGGMTETGTLIDGGSDIPS